MPTEGRSFGEELGWRGDPLADVAVAPKPAVLDSTFTYYPIVDDISDKSRVSSCGSITAKWGSMNHDHPPRGVSTGIAL